MTDEAWLQGPGVGQRRLVDGSHLTENTRYRQAAMWRARMVSGVRARYWPPFTGWAPIDRARPAVWRPEFVTSSRPHVTPRVLHLARGAATIVHQGRMHMAVFTWCHVDLGDPHARVPDGVPARVCMTCVLRHVHATTGRGPG